MEIKNPYTAFARASGAVSSSSLGLEDAPFSFTSAQLEEADMCLIQPTAQSCSVAFLGAAAVAADFVVAAGEHLVVYGRENIANLELIRTGGTDSTVLVVLFSG